MSDEIKVYTKGGDKGHTSLIGGTRVPKYHDKIEAYGTLDELNSFIGLIRDFEIDKRSFDTLIFIQNLLFTIESRLASTNIEVRNNMPEILEEDVVKLENEIDFMNKTLPELTNFILPGGSKLVSTTHIARTVCRRGERLMVKLIENSEIDAISLKFINRLSDYLFVLARKFSDENNCKEIIWQAKPR